MGRYGGAWSISSDITDVTTDSQGAVYATGSYRGTVDFDPGSAEVVRTSTDYPSSYVFKLGPGGVFQWVITPTRFSANAIALGGDGGVLVAGLFGADGIGGAGVIEIFPDQSRGGTVGFGNAYVRVTGLTSTANGFFVSWRVFRISVRRSSGESAAAPMTPRPPALDTAATSGAIETPPMPARKMGYSMPKKSQIGVFSMRFASFLTRGAVPREETTCQERPHTRPCSSAAGRSPTAPATSPPDSTRSP